MPIGVSKTPCGAKKATGEGTCHLNAGYGTSHPGFGRCKWHGGNTETGKVSAAKKAGMALIKYTDPHEIDPTTALLQELYRTAGHVQFLDQEISKWELKTDKEIPPEQQHWMRVHLVERAHMVKVAKTALDAGVAEREIRLAEQQGERLASAIERILDRLELSAAQLAMVPVIVPDILRSMTIEGEVIESGRD